MAFKIYLDSETLEQQYLLEKMKDKNWRTYVVKFIFIILVFLCSFTVAWFFTGSRYIPTISQNFMPDSVTNIEHLHDLIEEKVERKSKGNIFQKHGEYDIFNGQNSKEKFEEFDYHEIDPDIIYSQFPENCENEKERLFFLKTHKTASSVIENILYRYGLNYNKTFAMPRNGGLVFDYKNPFQTKWVAPLLSGKSPDILTQHIRYSSQAAELFPKEDSFRITILRDPGTLFPSLFKYFQMNNKPFRLANSVNNFLQNPQKFMAEGPGMFVTRNSMSFQLGFDNFAKREPSEAEFDEILKSLDTNYDLVLIADHLDESLILLRNKFCLTFNDISTLSKNVAIRKRMDDDGKQKARDWENVDTIIFQKANETLWKKIEEFGLDKMNEELKILRELNAKNSETCVKAYKPLASLPFEFRDYEPPGVKIEGIELKEGYTNVCYQIALSPFALAIDIIDKQCQSSEFLRRFAHLKDWPKSYGLQCPAPKPQ